MRGRGFCSREKRDQNEIESRSEIPEREKKVSTAREQVNVFKFVFVNDAACFVLTSRAFCSKEDFLRTFESKSAKFLYICCEN